MDSPTSLEFERLRTVAGVALHLQCSPDLLRDLLHKPERWYREIRIRRKSRTPRVVYEVVSPDLRRIHRTVALALGPHIARRGHEVQGFRKKKSIHTNAALHCDRAFVATADISDFFGNISLVQVARTFERLGASRAPAFLLARLCTYRGSLPQGARCSPALSNLAVQAMDEEMVAMAEAARQQYTRYADDLSFSGDAPPDQAAISAVLARHGFALRAGTYRLQTRAGGQYVTGLNVGGKEPKIPRRVRREVVRALRYSERDGIAVHVARKYGKTPPADKDAVATYVRRLAGRLHSYHPVEPESCVSWLAKLEQLNKAFLATAPPE